jgi:hypothetical protein
MKGTIRNLLAVAVLFAAVAAPAAQRQGGPERRPVPPPGGGKAVPITPPANAAPIAPGDVSLTPAVRPWTGPRTSDGQPDVSGSYAKNWVGARGPNFDIEEGQDAEGIAHSGRGADAFPVPQIVRTPDGRIPYQPWARALRIENRNNFFNPTELWHIDSNARCLPMGQPREALDQGFDIIQTAGLIVFNHGYNNLARQVYLDGRPPLSDKVKLWYGDAIGKWEGNSLVIESRNHNGAGWYDAYGNFHSEDLRLRERYVFDGDRVYYDAISDDPKVFTRPWTAHVQFVKSQGAPVEQWESACFEGERNVVRKVNKPS